MNENSPQLQKLLKLINTDRIISPDDIQQVITALTAVLANNKRSTDGITAQAQDTIQRGVDYVTSELEKLRQETAASHSQTSSGVEARLTTALQEVQGLVAEARAAMPKDGKDADETAIVGKVLEQIQLPEQKDVLLDGGVEIVQKINQLTPEDDKIDASHIKNLPQLRGGGALHGGFRNLKVYDEATIISKAVQTMKFVGAGVQATASADGSVITVTISGSASSESNGEVLTDSGTHLSFTFAHAPSTGGVRNVWRKESGQLLTPTTDYTISGSTLTATSAQVDGDGNAFTLIANYTY